MAMRGVNWRPCRTLHAELVALLATRPDVMSVLIRIFDRCVFDAIAGRVRRTEDERPKSGAVVLVQRFTKEV